MLSGRVPDGVLGHRVGRSGDAPAAQGRRDARSGPRETVGMIGRRPIGQGLFIDGAPGGDGGVRFAGPVDFVLSLGLDDMNMANSRTFPGAPLWNDDPGGRGPSRKTGGRMNCLNFVSCPKAIASRERLDQLFNEHVKRFLHRPPPGAGNLSEPLWEPPPQASGT